MELTEAKLSLLHTIAEALNERGIEATAENDSDSGELIIEFEGHTLILSSEDIVEDTDEDTDEEETVTCESCVKDIPADEAICCSGCDEVYSCPDCAGVLFDGKQECESCRGEVDD